MRMPLRSLLHSDKMNKDGGGGGHLPEYPPLKQMEIAVARHHLTFSVVSKAFPCSNHPAHGFQ